MKFLFTCMLLTGLVLLRWGWVYVPNQEFYVGPVAFPLFHSTVKEWVFACHLSKHAYSMSSLTFHNADGRVIVCENFFSPTQICQRANDYGTSYDCDEVRP